MGFYEDEILKQVNLPRQGKATSRGKSNANHFDRSMPPQLNIKNTSTDDIKSSEIPSILVGAT
jgi:hypothetical protein